MIDVSSFAAELRTISDAGLTKNERTLSSAQSSQVVLADGTEALNFCANNYLGLANDPEILAAAHDGLDRWGFGLASVRFICGRQEVHSDLERAISTFLGTEDTILYSSCFDANTGLFEILLDEHDVVISDELNHASIIDGIRLCKATRARYRNGDMGDLRKALEAARGARRVLIATDGVFSMDGVLADLPGICDLAEEFGAMVMVDDSHAVGIVGPNGRGTPEFFGVADRVDIVTGTLGKALGGASGGYVSGRREVVALLRQRSRPYLFSNSVAPVVASASVRALQLIDERPSLRTQLWENTRRFRAAMTERGFDVVPGTHPIVPVMFGDARVASAIAERLLDEGVYVMAFSYPVVPRDRARIRVQLSAAHTAADVNHAVAAFVAARSAVR